MKQDATHANENKDIQAETKKAEEKPKEKEEEKQKESEVKEEENETEVAKNTMYIPISRAIPCSNKNVLMYTKMKYGPTELVVTAGDIVRIKQKGKSNVIGLLLFIYFHKGNK